MGLERCAKEALIGALGDVGYVLGGELYVPVSAAGEALKACRDQALAVAGIEAFTLHDERIKPDLDLVADFSSLLEGAGIWGSVVRQTLEEAQVFIAHVPPDRYLNFTVFSETEALEAGWCR